MVFSFNQHEMTVKKVFGAWVDAEKRYTGTPPILICKTYPGIRQPGYLANGRRQDRMTYFEFVPHL